MKSIDYLIWVGASYTKVLCGSKKSCAIPFNKGLSHCFIHEAEWRGCCRKVPLVPPLAIIGKTRIFLAHRDGLHKKEQGRIFGYYVLANIEVIKGVHQPLSLPLQNFRKNTKSPQNMMVTGQCWDGSTLESSKLIDDRAPLLTPYSECHEGETKEKQCADSTVITTHKCVDGHWVKTEEKCDEVYIDDEECEEGKYKRLYCDENSMISHICINGEWVETGASCPKSNTPEWTMFEPERACSLRLKPESIYLLDPLANDISTHFNEKIEKEKLREKYLNAKSEKQKEKVIKEGRNIFIKIVDDVKKKRKTSTKIPKELKNKAKLRGEFVFFHAKTIFEKFPSSAFRGILRIDGDEVIKQVSEDKTKIEICYCDEDWESKLAQVTKSNKSFVKFFLKNLIKISKEELNSKEKFVVPNFGKFYVIETKERYGRNPTTGEKIKIPKQKRVRFHPFKNLKKFSESDS